MKRFLAILLAACLLSSAVMAQNATQFVSQSCSRSNRMRDGLRRMGVQIFRASQHNDEFCKGEWDIRGTCCNVQQVSDYTTKKTKQNDESLKLILTELELIAPNLQKFVDTYLSGPQDHVPAANNTQNSNSNSSDQQTDSSPLVSGSNQTESNQTQPNANQEAEQQTQPAEQNFEDEPDNIDDHSRRLQMLVARPFQHAPNTQVNGNSTAMAQLKTKILTAIKDLQENKASLAAQQTQCMAKINLIIALSPCSICSSKGYDYFSQGKLKMEEAVCRDVITDCHGAWVKLVSISKKVQEFSSLITTLVGIDLDQQTVDSNGKSVKLGHSIMSIAKEADLWNELSSCADPENCPFKDVADLCERFISLHEDNYAQKLSKRIKKSIEKTGDLKEILAKYQKKLKGSVKKIAKLIRKYLGNKNMSDLSKVKGLKQISKILKKFGTMQKKFKRFMKAFSKLVSSCKTSKKLLKGLKKTVKKLLKRTKKIVKKIRTYQSKQLKKLSKSSQLSKKKAILKKSLKCQKKQQLKSKSKKQIKKFGAKKQQVKSHQKKQTKTHGRKKLLVKFQLKKFVHKQQKTQHKQLGKSLKSVKAHSSSTGCKSSVKTSHEKKQTWSVSSYKKSSTQSSSSKKNSSNGRKLTGLLASGSNTGTSEIGVVPNGSCNPCAPINGMDGP